MTTASPTSILLTVRGTLVADTLEATRVLEEALAIDPEHADARSLYGTGIPFEKARRGNPALDPEA